MVLRVTGVDYESLDYGEQEYSVKRPEAALKNFEPGFHVYQYLYLTHSTPVRGEKNWTTVFTKVDLALICFPT